MQVPWTVVYDAKQRRSLSKLVITFSHDKYDIVRVASEKEYVNTDGYILSYGIFLYTAVIISRI